MNKYIDANRRNWDERAPIHALSKLYDLDAIRHGKSSLLPLEQELLGDVCGKNLLHLQCHIGTDSVSWARLGAHVTGLDISGESLAIARQLAIDCGMEVEFIQSNVYEAPEGLNGRFDIVVATYGIACWLPDIAAFMQVAKRCLKPGGRFLLIDDHPVASMLVPNEEGDFKLTGRHFKGENPHEYHEGTYTDADTLIKTSCYEWTHDLSEFVSGALSAGLTIESFCEYPFTFWRAFPQGMSQNEMGWWRLTQDSVPLMFSLLARRA